MVQMMKKWCIFFVVLFFGCFHIANAQMDAEIYVNLVDEIHEKYKTRFLALKKGKDGPELDGKVEMLRVYFEKKKTDFDNLWTNEQIINSLLLLPSDIPTPINDGFAGFLKDETKSLRADLEIRLMDEPVNATSAPVAVSQNTDNKSKSSLWQWAIGIVCIVLLLYIGLKYRRQIEKLLSKKDSDSPHYRYRSEVPDDDYVTIRAFEVRMRKLEARIEQLEKRGLRINTADIADELMKNESFNHLILSDLRRGSYKTESIPSPTNTNAPREQRSQNQPFFYADTINNGEFYRVGDMPTEDTVYELRQLSEKSATFRVFPEAYAKVLRRPNFLEGCVVQKIGENGVETVELGEAILDQGVWTIRKRAKVRFI